MVGTSGWEGGVLVWGYVADDGDIGMRWLGSTREGTRVGL